MRGLRNAVSFLTTIPIGSAEHLQAGDLSRAAIWYPVVGLAVGLALAGAWEAITPRLSSHLAGALIVALWVLVTGALHLDGLADCCDGLLAPAAPDRRLEMMGDSRTGVFGVVGLTLLLLLKVTTVASLVSSTALVLAPVLGRWWMLPLGINRPAKPEGLGAALHEELNGKHLLIPAALVAGAVIYLGITAVIALIVTGVVTLALGLTAARRIGGQTGDVLGANCELVEWITLLTFVLM